MIGGDITVLGGIISATTLIALDYAVAFMTYKSRKMEAWIEGTPRILIRDGVLNEDVMRSELLTRHELAAALRAAGCAEIERVRVATLENNGQINISLQPHSI
jgi:uncharacterized membrane protein YcaP (DUF421 family)